MNAVRPPSRPRHAPPKASARGDRHHMASPEPKPDPDYESPILSWERKVPWYRRVSGRTGLQGKLVLSFMFLLTVSLGSSCWLFLTESHVVLDRIMSDQAVAVAQTLAMAGETPMAE